MKRQVVILANSFRESQRCVAGIDIHTGEWVRPVPPPSGGAMPWALRNVGGREPELREIVEMSVQDEGPDEGCQPENRLLDRVPWKHVGIMPVEEIMKYCESDAVILHDDSDSVDPDYFKRIPKARWKSLQLVHPAKVEFYARSAPGKKKWRALIHYSKGKLLDLSLTDPIAVDRLAKGNDIGADCLLTVSLGGAWTPRDGSQPARCYKLAAGVIEL